MMWHDNFPKSLPRAAKGGIKAQSQRGGFGQSWWAKRWIQVLEGFSFGSRLERGRSYARRGQVLDIAIEAGVVTAKVQGSRANPYAVRIAVKTLSKEQTAKLGAALGEQVIFAAKLLAGEMPQEIEQVFAAAQLSLFPSNLDDLTTECSCPDWSNPCKHVAAVYYLIGEEFDRDPFLLFKLRGIDRERLLASLNVGQPDKPARTPRKKAVPKAPTEPLSAEANAFWHGADLPGDLFGEISPPPIPAALPRRLGNFPFWRGQKPLLEVVEPIYVVASEREIGMK